MRRALTAAAMIVFPSAVSAQPADPPLWQYQEGQRPHWASPENPRAAPGAGGPGESRRQGPRV